MAKQKGPYQVRPAIYRLTLTKTAGLNLGGPYKVLAAKDILPLAKKTNGQAAREEIWAVAVNSRNETLIAFQVSSGGTDSCPLSVAEVFKPVLLVNGTGVALWHNHPSGTPTVSVEDIAATEKVISAGKLFQIRVLDHVIVGPDDLFISMRRSHAELWK